MVKSEGFKGFFKKTSNRDACTRLMELTLTILYSLAGLGQMSVPPEESADRRHPPEIQARGGEEAGGRGGGGE